MIPHLRHRELQLERCGWRGPEAEWIALVCLHSGLFYPCPVLRLLPVPAQPGLVVRPATPRSPPGRRGALGRPSHHPALPHREPGHLPRLGPGARSALACPAARRPAEVRVLVLVRDEGCRHRARKVLRRWRRERPPTGHQWLTSAEHQEVKSIRQAVLEGEVGTLGRWGGLRAAMRRRVPAPLPRGTGQYPPHRAGRPGQRPEIPRPVRRLRKGHGLPPDVAGPPRSTSAQKPHPDRPGKGLSIAPCSSGRRGLTGTLLSLSV